MMPGPLIDFNCLGKISALCEDVFHFNYVVYLAWILFLKPCVKIASK